MTPPTDHHLEQRLGEALNDSTNKLTRSTASKRHRSLLYLIETNQLVDLHGHGTSNFQHGHGSTSCSAKAVGAPCPITPSPTPRVNTSPRYQQVAAGQLVNRLR